MERANVEGQEWNWEALERQDWHLWILAMLLLFVLGVSLLSFMFPSAFWPGRDVAATAPQQAFFGFCVLLALTLVYLLQRQATIRRLKRSLYRAEVAATEAEQEVRRISLTSLPEVSQFRDSLAMEYKRASRAGEPLSVILFDLPDASADTLGQAAYLLRQALRPHEALFRIAGQRFGLIFPAMRSADASAFSTQLTDQLHRVLSGEGVSSTVIAYPDQAGSLAELEGRVRVLVP
jgi:GGDEF domain-containing protein